MSNYESERGEWTLPSAEFAGFRKAMQQQQQQQQDHGQQRQPRGAPASTGGQFAAKARDESDVELDDSATDWGADPWG